MNYHTPVMLWESINGLNIDPSGIYVDATFGGGGHSREILARLTEGRLFGLDQDKEAFSNIPANEKFCFIHGNFRFIRNYLRYYGISKVDGIMADLGISSHHIDMPDRGFSYNREARLDMRMNTASSFTAAGLINHYSRTELQRIFKTWGELENSRSLADAIIKYRENTEILYNHQLIEAVSSFIPSRHEKKYLSKLFQSLRIEVNREIFNLKELLLQSVRLLKKGGWM